MVTAVATRFCITAAMPAFFGICEFQRSVEIREESRQPLGSHAPPSCTNALLSVDLGRDADLYAVATSLD